MGRWLILFDVYTDIDFAFTVKGCASRGTAPAWSPWVTLTFVALPYVVGATLLAWSRFLKIANKSDKLPAKEANKSDDFKSDKLLAKEANKSFKLSDHPVFAIMIALPLAVSFYSSYFRTSSSHFSRCDRTCDSIDRTLHFDMDRKSWL